MLTGTTIEDLTAMVQAAEAHAEHDQQERVLAPWTPETPVARSNKVYELVRACGVGAA